MSSSRPTQMLRTSSFGEVRIQRMNKAPVGNWKKKRPAGAVDSGGSTGRSIRSAQEMGLIKKSMVMEAEEDLESGIFALGVVHFDENFEESVDESFGGFLKKCSFCSRCITGTMDVFMYGYLKAFCSPECRDEQIEIDESIRPSSPVPTAIIAKIMGADKAAEMTSPEVGFCSKVKNHALSMFK